jgi:hypothetical protein
MEGSKLHAACGISARFALSRRRIRLAGAAGFTGTVRKTIAGASATAGRWIGKGSTRGKSINIAIVAVAASTAAALNAAQRNGCEFFRDAIAPQ